MRWRILSRTVGNFRYKGRSFGPLTHEPLQPLKVPLRHELHWKAGKVRRKILGISASNKIQLIHKFPKKNRGCISTALSTQR